MLPNAWDAMSARIFADAGFDAIATTSGGAAWSLGYADGEHTPWAEVVAATTRIVRAACVPVTADIEAGYGDSPDAVMNSIADIIRAAQHQCSRRPPERGAARSARRRPRQHRKPDFADGDGDDAAGRAGVAPDRPLRRARPRDNPGGCTTAVHLSV